MFRSLQLATDMRSDRDEVTPRVLSYKTPLSGQSDISLARQPLYPETQPLNVYNRIFGKDYVPEPYIKKTYDYARNHKWYMDARMITVHDLYAFQPDMKVSLDPFIDIIGRHFKQPKEGLGFDNSPTAHMWRTMIFPDHPL